MLRTKYTRTINVAYGYVSQIVKPPKPKVVLSGQSVVVVGSVAADGSVVLEGIPNMKISGSAVAFPGARTDRGYVLGESLGEDDPPSKVRIGPKPS